MNEESKYTVSELADQVGVPRTTINDWLSKYSQYIDSSLQGRRRIYAASALLVLKTVAELRADNLSSFDIEAELAKRFAVHAEPEAEEQRGPQVQTQEQAPGPEAGQDKPSGAAPDGYALVSKKQTEDIDRAVAESFRLMAAKMEAMENESRTTRRRMTWWFAFLLVVLFSVLGAAALAVMKMKSLEHANAELGQDAETREQLLKNMNEQIVTLAGSSAELQKNLRTLEKELPEQQKRFDSMIAEQKASQEKTQAAELARKDAEMALEKEKFAREKLEYLRNLEHLSNDQEQIINGLQDKIRKLEAEKIKPAEPEKKVEAVKDESISPDKEPEHQVQAEANGENH